MPEQKKPCLVIAPIGDPGTDIRRRSDDVLELVIRPALEPLGYAPQRADEISEPGNITSQVIQRLIDDPLVVADLTGRNPNVFYELAVRHATKRPLIQLIQRGESIPFDVAVMRTISVDLTARGAQEAVAAIKDQEKAIQAKGNNSWTNPISGAIDLQKLFQSERTEDRSIAAILEGISELKSLIWETRKPAFDPDDRPGFAAISSSSGPVAVSQKEFDRFRVMMEAGKTAEEALALVLDMRKQSTRDEWTSLLPMMRNFLQHNDQTKKIVP